ncbi:ABC transporter ATP-binding protein [Haloplanus aerogenes]|uniref:ABC transporter ATP-binding protein n=1 Tax=Haloplanus aerogenes TaxID=660522 RepID=A0A3M0DP38_9EURY|nr:ABC transporter ATP-binding protein [Haloplanus aerogenes]AZH24746.1 ABC transporter ATP-binding protein [Haloplanus aerogenes]RMB23592.1 ABC-2 type transport system ATP-binding protein [Haloplanus aerogenes]
MPSTDIAIEATDLRKTYGSEVALDGVSFSISAGTVYGFLGPNGAGKTTTMRLLTGLSQPTSGAVRVSGTPVDDRRALAAHVGYLPETPPLYDEFSAREQLDYVADLRDIPPNRARERIDDYLDRFDLADDADRRIESYSKGMRQKTAFVQSVLHDPDVLFLDEPTSGLDPRAARRIREFVTEFADTGTTIFLSTHILPVVDAVADEIGVLFEGRLVAEGTPSEVKARAEMDEHSSLEDAFLAVTSEGAGAGDGESEHADDVTAADG